MDPQTASYYRSILFHDGEDQRPLPPSLLLLHAWAIKRLQAMSAGSIIPKQAALCLVMTWMSSTKEGREFAVEHTNLGELFCDEQNGPLTTIRELVPDDNAIDWDTLAPKTPVVVTVNKKAINGEFLARRGGNVDVLIGGEKKQYGVSQVQLAGA